MRVLRWSILFFLTCAVTSFALWSSWQRGIPQGWLVHCFEKYLLWNQIQKIQPSLPFQVKTVQINAPWEELKNGKILEVRTQLHWSSLQLELTGPLELNKITDSNGTQVGWSAQYSPLAVLRSIDGEHQSLLKLENAQAMIRFQAKKDLKQFTAAEVSIQGKQLQLPGSGLQIESPTCEAKWDGQSVALHVTGKALDWTNPGKQIRIESPSLLLNSGLTLDPFKLGPIVHLSSGAKSGEALFGDAYLDLPLKNWSVRAKTEIDLNSKHWLKSMALQLTQSQNSWLEFEIHSHHLKWKTRAIPLRSFLEKLSALPTLSLLSELKIRDGTLKTQGEAQLSEKFEILKLKGELEVKDLSLQWPKKAAAIRGFQASLPFTLEKPDSSLVQSDTWTGGLSGKIEAKDLYFMNFHGKLGKTDFTIQPGNKSEAGDFYLQTTKDLPLEVIGVPLKIGALQGKVYPSGHPSGYELWTSAQLAPIPIHAIAKGLCIDGLKIPPGTLQMDFSKIELTPGSIEPQGGGEARLFGGTFRWSDVGIFDLLSDVPEIDFSSKWDGLHLDQLGEWLNFGGMDGILTGYARDVTFQAWLPTHYDFKFEVKPFEHRNIEFSSMAMKNVVRLFAGEDVEAIPGLADWLAFGLPSRLLGGYNVDYVGMAAQSSEGSILITTLDPEKIAAREGKHFFLYGPRFKMPLKSSRYPLIADATAMGNFVRHMMKQFSQLAEQKANEEKKNEPEKPCLPPDF